MLIAREKERETLLEAYRADHSQFVAIYGRRRIGKTFLVRETFNYTFAFEHAGIARGGRKDQLLAFCNSARSAGATDFAQPTCWLEAFELVKAVVRNSDEDKKVVFIDELSWMDTPRSDFMTALESFWNGWASGRKDIVLIVCASATSWMVDNVIHNRGGLYNRLTAQIHLRPFTLRECEQLLEAKGVSVTRHQVLEGYMAFGGVPYYWDLMRKDRSLAQNIDMMIFSQDAPLKDEFDYLYASLFKKPEEYVSIVAALGTRKAGMTRKELSEATGQAPSGGLTKRLADLERCGFIRRYYAFGKKNNGALYQLVDNFTLFYYKFLQRKPTDPHYWEHQVNTPRRNAWCGLAFERVCLEHVEQTKYALGISGVLTDVCSWSCGADAERGIYGSQIDLLISRADHVINLCEMKYSADVYSITKNQDECIRHKIHDFQTLAKSRDAIHVTFVTPYGIAPNSYAGNVQSQVTAEDLFAY